MRYLSTIRLEVKRKFAALNHSPPRADCGRPPFRSLQHLGRNDFQDVYYDHEGRLSRAGTWLRQTNGKWESEIARGGDYTNSQFEKSPDPDTISANIQRLTGLDNGVLQSFSLSRIATLTTFRESWKADHKFKVVFDRTDFGHAIGEVELETEVHVKNEQEIAHVMERMYNRITNFL